MHGARAAARILGRASAALLAFALLFPLLHRMAARPLVLPAVALAVPPDSEYDVRVVDWGYHTAIVLPQPASWRLGPPGREGAAYVEYAWGDRRFYRDSDYRPHALFATLVLPTAAVAYVAARDRPPSLRSGARAVYVRRVSAWVLHALAVELERHIVRDATGARVAPGPPVAGYGGRFYDAAGRYLWTSDCNDWTVARLAAAGLATRGGLVVIPRQVPGHLVGFVREDARGTSN